MRNLLVPRKLLLCQLADGHPVRVLSLNSKNDQLKVKSMRTGLPFFISRSFVYEAAKPAA
ncbi:MAG: hypothetical protein JWP58_3919 [Hymenobacter sp.]|nr:hypothetical protein [Hymenobacter sp.]